VAADAGAGGEFLLHAGLGFEFGFLGGRELGCGGVAGGVGSVHTVADDVAGCYIGVRGVLEGSDESGTVGCFGGLEGGFGDCETGCAGCDGAVGGCEDDLVAADVGDDGGHGC